MRLSSVRVDLRLISLLVVAFAIRCYLIYLPGPYGDEALFVLPAYQMRWGDLTSTQAVVLLGHRLPLTVNAYTGALPVYAQFAFSYLTGDYWFGFRILDIFYAVATIAVSYSFTQDLFGQRTALLTAILFSFMPSSVFYSRLGEPVIFLRLLLSTLMLFLGYRWWRSNNWWYFRLGCFIFGLGLSTRLEIIWWVIAIALYLRLANPGLLQAIRAELRVHRLQVLTGAGFAVVGAIPFLSYNVYSGAGTVAYVVHNLIVTFYGHHNLAFGQNFQKRLADLVVFLSGTDRSFVAYFGPVFKNSISAILFFACFILLIGRSIYGRVRREPELRTEFLIVTTTLMFVISTFTVSVLAPYQLLIMMPLPLLVIVHALDSSRLRIVGGIIIVVILAGDLSADALYYRSLKHTEGVGLFSSGIFDLARYLRGSPRGDIVVCDWGILPPLEFISEDKIRGMEIFGYELGPERTPPFFYEELRRALQNPDSLYVFHAPQYEQYKRHQVFLKYLNNHGLSHERNVLYDRNGPTYYIYRAQRRPVRLGGPRH